LSGNRRDYYEVLELSKECSSSDIKQAYRQLARRYHPDVNNGDAESEEKFKEVSEAYAVLSNEEKRRQYDANGFSGSLFDGINFNSVFSEFGFGDIFNMFFGNSSGGGFSSSRGRSARQARGTDVAIETLIDFKESAFGTKKEVEYTVDINCEECQGKGSKTPGGIITCVVCGGSGQVRTSRDTFLGSIITTSICQRCGGAGKVVKDPCSNCGGKGYLRGKKKMVLDIPSGVNNGDQLRVPQKGNSKGADSVSGDLLIGIRVKPHPGFTREASNVLSTLNISFAQAALGTKVEIETLDKIEEIQIKAGTQPGAKIVLKSKGIIPLNGARRGDHIIFINVIIPASLSSEEITLLKKYADGREETVGDGPAGFFSGFKNAFKK
jgi:molecular chaperone DnaJ